MKKITRTVAALAMLLAAPSGMAKDIKKEPKLEIEGTSKSLVFEWDAHLIKTSVKIYDKEGNVFYKDHVEDVETYAKKFDLRPLEAGQYFLKVENSLKKVLYSIEINKEEVFILGKEETHKPVFRNKDGLVSMSFLNLAEEEVNILVMDSSGTVLFEETVIDSYLVGKSFNFKSAIKDDYTIIVENDKNVFYETIAIK